MAQDWRRAFHAILRGLVSGSARRCDSSTLSRRSNCWYRKLKHPTRTSIEPESASSSSIFYRPADRLRIHFANAGCGVEHILQNSFDDCSWGMAPSGMPSAASLPQFSSCDRSYKRCTQLPRVSVPLSNLKRDESLDISRGVIPVRNLRNSNMQGSRQPQDNQLNWKKPRSSIEFTMLERIKNMLWKVNASFVCLGLFFLRRICVIVKDFLYSSLAPATLPSVPIPCVESHQRMYRWHHFSRKRTHPVLSRTLPICIVNPNQSSSVRKIWLSSNLQLQVLKPWRLLLGPSKRLNRYFISSPSIVCLKVLSKKNAVMFCNKSGCHKKV